MSIHDAFAQRLFVDSPLVEGEVLNCSKEQAHYLLNVLRVKDGEALLIFNGRDGEWRSTIAVTGKRACCLKVQGQVRSQTNGPDIQLLFAPLKRARLDYMIQKAAELGVAKLIPVLTQHTVPDRVNTERMRANAIEAAEQCGILFVPEISQPLRLGKLLDAWDSSRTLIFCDEGADVSNPVESLATVGRSTPVAVLIGPEGGFSRDERALIQSHACVHTISLGPRVMRADTAATAALTLVNATIGDWR